VSGRYDAWARRTVRVQPFWFFYRYWWRWTAGWVYWTPEDYSVPWEDRRVPKAYWIWFIGMVFIVVAVIIAILFEKLSAWWSWYKLH
jgi:hypothetical protein